MPQNLTEYIKRYVPISETEIAIFKSYLKPKTLQKKDFLLREGQVCKSRYFITKGCVRLYYINDKGNEQIIHFAIDNWWFSEYDSLLNKTPSNLYIQATENTTLLELSEPDFNKLCIKLPQTDTLFRKIMEKSYIAAQKRIAYMFSLTGEALFNDFITANPTFTKRVPQYMIASYLGMSPEFVSKIKRK